MTSWLGAFLPERRAATGNDVAFYLPTVTPLLTGGSAGGAETQVRLVASALANAGLRVALIAFPAPDLPARVAGVEIVARPETKAHQRLVGRLREVARIRRAFVDARARVVVGRVAGPDVAVAAFVAKLTGRRFVYSSASLRDFTVTPSALRRRDSLLYRLALRIADTVVVQTDEQAESCKRLVGRPAVVVRSVAEPAPERTATPKAFLWIGRIDANKRPLAFVELARALPDVAFRMVAVPVAAEQALLAEVERQAATIPNLELLSPRPRHEVGALIAEAAAVVSTSRYEGLPNVFLEAWIRGVPALALSYDPDSMIARFGLGVCAGDDPDELAAAARRLWDESQFRLGLGARCRAFALEHHAPEAIARQWIDALGFGVGADEIAGGVAPAC